MTITFQRITNENTLEDAICAFVEKCTGIPCYIYGFEYKRVRPRAVLNIVSTSKNGKNWINKVFTSGVERTYTNSSKLTCDVNIYTDTYKSDGSAVTSNARYYSGLLRDNAEIFLNKSDLESAGLKLVTINPTVSNETRDEDDKFIKVSGNELVFNYNHSFKTIDTDKITDIETPTINISE